MLSCFLGKHIIYLSDEVNFLLSFVLFHKLQLLFLYRGDDGQLRLGVRRAVQLRNEALFEPVNSSDSKLRILSSVASSLENKSVFHICFNPRSGASEFIVPYWRLLKSLNHPFSIGMRFRVCYESEDANERSALLSQPNGISLSQIS
jgi:hypothetical protein